MNTPEKIRRKAAPDWVWLAFFTSIAAVGYEFWTKSYSELDLPDAYLHLGMAVPVLAVLAARAKDVISSWRALNMFALAAPIANIIRIQYDVSIDPTRHNLLPFELIISAMTGYFFAAIGVLAGNFLLWLRRRHQES